MKRLVYVLVAAVAALVAGFGVLSNASASSSTAALGNPTFTQDWNGAGSEFLPCEAGTLTWEFNLAGPTQADPSVTLTVNGANYPGVQTGDFTYSFTSPGAGVTTSSNVFVTYSAPKKLQEAAVSIVSCDTEETTSTSPTESTNTSPTESTNTSPTESTNTSPTESTNTSPSESTLPSESTRTSPNESTLPSESTRPVPTAVDAGVSGPTSGGGSSHLGSVLGVLGGLALASAGAFALMRRRGQHEA